MATMAATEWALVLTWAQLSVDKDLKDDVQVVISTAFCQGAGSNLSVRCIIAMPGINLIIEFASF
jgi:hypothetical protein